MSDAKQTKFRVFAEKGDAKGWRAMVLAPADFDMKSLTLILPEGMRLSKDGTKGPRVEIALRMEHFESENEHEK